ncbi:glucosamine/fructose-6-phosphate aminotransferase, isomerizing [Desulfofarcimen acetoxidans DSM 771]|jgi:glucosamine--fructose-6-phosphate aminotransferase (isomerizing)|uniref:Glutamine--fructose-6-phosphate aminotransferase [isomerizing] n=1 Tax=Desulfofarcimen acetoxidans (strain ATCC 49208 / DSM 771 / KCTC 5769 / VKM B-1644 / 5575) TaxID=485916 RepID=C8W671_DESAS|nr:glutamine--fructose-6-phosphate transaminase (isomerizing) [Desulfofarcimen acetoxidans]ACV61526.1 glucosamine/fructose-6-phosphate aminotransferase, isomerizing [Desulfofarcimen acetoxidans DSM 771]
MCGIVGYIGTQEAVPILIDGLKKLEYRGYDSAGIAVLENGIRVEKKVGKLAALEESLEGITFTAQTGIGHTRWATHGKPSDENAHPHTDCTGKFAVVHNGIIENYLHLRDRLKEEGHEFISETDTEVLPHLLEKYYRGDLVEAVRLVIQQLRGSYAMVVLCMEEPDKIVAARQDSPLVVGLGENENFLASDIPAILKYTKRALILEDGEIVVLTADKVTVFNRSNHEVDKKVFEVPWKAEQAEKQGYEHFMLKEIFEQPKVLRDTVRGRISDDNSSVLLKDISLGREEIKKIKKLFITACGTAYHAGVVGKYVIEKLVRLPVEVDIASEYRYRDPIIDPDSLVIVISQSGETADTLAALREAHRKGARVIAVTNVVDSSIAREADDVIYTWAGPEIAVASTKAYTTQLIAMYLLALYFAEIRGTLQGSEINEILTSLRQVPGQVQEMLNDTAQIQDFAGQYARHENAFFIGRGLDYTVATEGALKLKEISYIHAEAYAAGELKHGTLALIVENMPVVALATQPALLEKMISNIKEVHARGASIIGVALEGIAEMEEVSEKVIYIPRTHPVLTSVLTVVPLQLLAYYMAVARGCDVDKPRNLAKAVTVE